MKTLIAKTIGLLASFGSMILAIILLYFNPYSNENNRFGTGLYLVSALLFLFSHKDK